MRNLWRRSPRAGLRVAGRLWRRPQPRDPADHPVRAGASRPGQRCPGTAPSWV